MDPRTDARQRKLVTVWAGAALALVGSIVAEVVFLGDYLLWAVGPTVAVCVAIAVVLTRRVPSSHKAEPNVTVWQLRDQRQRQLRRKSQSKA